MQILLGLGVLVGIYVVPQFILFMLNIKERKLKRARFNSGTNSLNYGSHLPAQNNVSVNNVRYNKRKPFSYTGRHSGKHTGKYHG